MTNLRFEKGRCGIQFRNEHKYVIIQALGEKHECATPPRPSLTTGFSGRAAARPAAGYAHRSAIYDIRVYAVPRVSLFQKRKEHRHPTSVIIVVLPKKLYEVMLFEPDADEDVDRGRDGEKQMPSRHGGCCPESDDESKHNGMANVTVQTCSLEFYMVVFLVAKVEPDLSKSKQIEVINHERGQQHGDPSEPEETQQKCFAGRVLHAPNHIRHGAPLPIEQQQNKAGDEDERASLHLHRDNLRPPSLKREAGHDGVLNCEEAKHSQVHDQTLGKA